MDARSSRYHEVYARWQRDPQGFWGEAAQDIDWFEKPKTVFDAKAGIYGRWFVGGVCNTCFNAVDRQVDAGRGDQIAIIYDSPVTGTKRTLTYHRLLTETQVLAAILRDFGVEKGDRVVLYMPMVPEAVVAMLACARIGAIHSVVFGGFAARELATRIDDAKPRVILSASCGIEPGRVVAYKPLLDEAITLAAHKPDACLILQRPQLEAAMVAGRDHDWASKRDYALVHARSVYNCVPVLATDPLYILYTSGTTGRPKGVVRDNGGHMVALKWTMKNLYGIDPGEVWWTASDIGWVVGHSYIVYAPLLHGATSILYEGKPVGTPDAGAFWRVSSEHGAVALFTAPTAFRAIKKEDPQGKLLKQYDLSKFRTLFLAGERADPATLEWSEAMLKVPVIDHWWQTETGSPMVADPVGLGLLPIKHGSPTVPMPGYDIHVVDEACKEVPANTMGSIVVKLPLPPACLPTLWQDDARFKESYLTEFPGYYKTADAGFKDEDGYLFVMGRTDDIINVAGHRLSTGGMEEVLSFHPDVAECAVLGIKDELKGEVPCGFIVLKSGVNRPPTEIEKECIALIREKIGPVASFRLAITVGRLPKTRSGKILRGTIKKIADGESWTMPATIDDPAVLDEIGSALKGKGVGSASIDAESPPPATIKFVVGIAVQGPIVPGEYAVDFAKITVDYPSEVSVGLPTPLKIPKGVSTVFVVSWPDKRGRTQEHFRSKSFERHLPIYVALDLINKLLMAFKLVRIGHADGMRIRTVGISDTLFYFSFVNDVPTQDLNIGMRLDKRDYPWLARGNDWFDHSGTTPLASPHINAETYPIARRFVRCFELLEHGFYKVAIIVSHAILDDLVADMINAQLELKGLNDDESRELLVRAVKESRLRIYLGPLLKVLSGSSIEEIWPGAESAINWLNNIRNKIAHRGSSGDRDSACKAIFVSMKTAAALHSRNLITAEFPPGMFRQARIGAAWTLNPEPWVPVGEGIESDPFDPTATVKKA